MSNAQNRSVSFTLKSNGIANKLITNCDLSLPAKIEDYQKAKRVGFLGLWDTGATATVISKRAADALGLTPVGRVNVAHAAGNSEVNQYLINLLLPNGVCIGYLPVTEGILSGFDVLIGMDVIGQGDFSVTNADGNTWFSFRVPSIQHRDFVKEYQDSHKHSVGKSSNPFVNASKNKPCPCGSGKQYKHCHGKDK